MQDDDRAFFAKQIRKLEIFPNDSMPKEAKYLLCSAEPEQASYSHRGYCVDCHCQVYFQDANPNLDRICPACARKRYTPETRSVTNVATLKNVADFILNKSKRN